MRLSEDNLTSAILFAPLLRTHKTPPFHQGHAPGYCLGLAPTSNQFHKVLSDKSLDPGLQNCAPCSFLVLERSANVQNNLLVSNKF